MKNKFFTVAISVMIMSLALSTGSIFAQTNSSSKAKKTKEEKAAEQVRIYARIDTLLKSRRFVFKAEFNQGSDQVFVIVDSAYAAVQNGNRNNLEGKITQFEIKKNEKQKNFSVTMMMRGSMDTADVFIFIGSDGSGTATIKSDFPGYFTFNGEVVSFDDAVIYQGGSHFLH